MRTLIGEVFMNIQMQKQYSKSLMRCMMVGYGVCMLALIGLLTAQMIVGSNVVYAETAWVNVIDIAVTLIDILGYTIAASTVIYGVYLFGAKGITRELGMFLCLTVLHYVAIMCIGWGLFGLPETLNDLLSQFWGDMLLFVLLDCLRIALILYFSAKALDKYQKRKHLQNKAAALIGNQTQGAREGIFPLRTLISLKNPIQVGVFAAAVIYWLTFVLQYVYIDILSLIEFGRIEEFFMQIIYVLLNAILATVCYVLINYVLIKMDEKMPYND
jgi:hypothetical protein